MADVRWYAIVDADGNLVSQASIDLDDPDTAIDPGTGMPYSRSNEQSPLHGRIAAPFRLAEKVLSIAEAVDETGRSVNPQTTPPDDPEGRYEFDPTARRFRAVSGAVLRVKRLEVLRDQEAALESEMRSRGESIPSRAERA